MRTLLLLLCLAPQDQTEEIRNALNLVTPALKDPAYSQIEWEAVSGSVTTTGVAHVKRGQAWRIDQTFVKGGQTSVWDGKGYLQYLKTSNRYFRNPKEPVDMLTSMGGPLIELHYSGHSDRLMKGLKKATLKKEKDDDAIEYSHIVLVRNELGTEVELHLHLYPGNVVRRCARKWSVKGKAFETTYTYKMVDPPTTNEQTFAFRPPADAKDMGGN